MHLFLSAEESDLFLEAELRRAFPSASVEAVAPGLMAAEFAWPAENSPLFAFARQVLPEARACQATSINAWAAVLLEAVGADWKSAPPGPECDRPRSQHRSTSNTLWNHSHANAASSLAATGDGRTPTRGETSAAGGLPDEQPWQLHIVAHYGVGSAGQHRCELIRAALRELLRRKRRHLLRSLRPEPTPFTPADGLVQLLLTGPEAGFLSVSTAPRAHALRRVVSPFPKGDIPVASDQVAPSRAFAKLVEAEARLGRRIAHGETCVDLGAAPGSWSYVALQRGARVQAVDRAPLREDLMRHPNLVFHQGDAFGFVPEAPVDWLLCDVIAAPQRSIDLVLEWIRQRRARHFVVTIKFKGHDEYGLLEGVKQALPALCEEFGLTRLCANKNEACVFGTVRREGRMEEGQ